MSLKCPRCGRIVGITARGLKLKDSMICFKCFEELGFDKSDRELAPYKYTYDEIKDGKLEYELRRHKEQIIQDAIANVSISIQRHGEERELDSTDGENELFRILKYIVGDLEFDSAPLRLVRVSDNYVTAKYNDWDLARFKYSDRAKWILFPTLERQNEKHYIESADDVFVFTDIIKSSLEHIEKYSKV